MLEIQIDFLCALGDDEEQKSEVEAAEKYYDTFERDSISIAEALKKLTRGSSSSRSDNSSEGSHRPCAKLPQIQLPTFGGSFTEWRSFANAYKSLIHDNEQIDKCSKLHYLRSALKGEAWQAIASIDTSEDSYDIAWSLLERRYQNERLIVNEHVKSILNLPEVNKQQSYAGLLKLLNDVTYHTAALKSLKIPVDQWDAILVPVVSRKFDIESSQLWETTLNTAVATFNDLMEFLQKRCRLLKSFQSHRSQEKAPTTVRREIKPAPQRSYVVTNDVDRACWICHRPHPFSECPELLSLSPSERIKKCSVLQVCKNCFSKAHKTPACKSRSRCATCGLMHHTLLHLNQVKNVRIESSTPTGGEVTETSTGTATHFATGSANQVLLSTAVLLVAGKDGNWVPCRTLLDQGSQLNFMSVPMLEKLRVEKCPVNFSIAGIAGAQSKVRHMAKLAIKSRFNDWSTTIDCLILDQITQNLPSVSFSEKLVSLPADLPLADPQFAKSGPVECLLGARLFWELLLQEQVRVPGQSSLWLTNTHAGWLIGGQLDLQRKGKGKSPACHLAIGDLQELHQRVEQFWTQEEIPSRERGWTKEESECDRHFTDTFSRDKDGRFQVDLPLLNGEVDLGNSRALARKRFLLLEKRFRKDRDLHKLYSECMQQYLDQGHLEKVSPAEIDNFPHFYLPHHAVPKGTNKVRIVYDASALSENKRSLNDNLMKGPVLQDDLWSILMRFRLGKYAFTADVKDMYRQVVVNAPYTDLQRILWRFDESEPVQSYRLSRVTFGVKPSSFLAIRAIQELTKGLSEKYPKACEIILYSTYVDDILASCERLEEARAVKQQLESILSQGCFRLAKWAYNDQTLLKDANEEAPGATEERSGVVQVVRDGISKTLGLFWDCFKDVFIFRCHNMHTSGQPTKRRILSIVSQLFDPLGFIAPIIVKGKLIIQQLWLLNLEWDQEIPSSLCEVWQEFLFHLKDLADLEIPRWVAIANTIVYDLCVFSDASMQAYGAVIYLRVTDQEGNCESHLICSKSRVAPVKTVSLPRLELSGAVLAVRLEEVVRNALRVPIRERYFFVDSTIVLHWLASPASSWQAYVGNRIGEIQEKTDASRWRHVRSNQNAADLITRGLFPSQIKDNRLWWHGPTWLVEPEEQWLATTIEQLSPRNYPEEVLEKRKMTHTVTVIQELPVFTKYSSFDRLQRVIGYCLRFIKNCRGGDKAHGQLLCSELQDATVTIVKHLQASAFRDEIVNLSQGRVVDRKSKLTALDPFLDDKNLIRVGGRIKHAEVTYDKKHPIVLPKHEVTELLARREHIMNLHSGPQLTLATLRARYWPIGARNLVRKIFRSCRRCFKAEPRMCTAKMGDLPTIRLQPARPFLNIGIDFFGPLYIKQGIRRNAKIVKSYGALFVCLVTKAVHLELVSDLTSEAFINAMKRLVARRGNVANIYCDNATNFVGANRELREAFNLVKNSEFAAEFARHFIEITWNFIPPRSPNFGSLWERLVRSTKQHLKRVLGNAAPNFEEMAMLLSQIAAVINSRPLTPLNDDPNDLDVLTPGHLIIGQPLVAPVEPSLLQVPENRLSRWQRIEQLRQQMWKRWHQEVLVEMQRRAKWRKSPATQITPGCMVLISEDNTPPLLWKLGRVIDVYTGQDGQIRVANIKTAGGIIKRNIRKLCVLPMEADVN